MVVSLRADMWTWDLSEWWIANDVEVFHYFPNIYLEGLRKMTKHTIKAAGLHASHETSTFFQVCVNRKLPVIIRLAV
jgi:hypothetical protein